MQSVCASNQQKKVNADKAQVEENTGNGNLGGEKLDCFVLMYV